MKFRTLIVRNLRFHWRAHLGVVLGAAIGSVALIGALVVGDSVRESLRENALARLGWVDAAMTTGDRLVTRELALRFVPENGFSALRPVAFVSGGLNLPGIATRNDSSARANHVNVIGMTAESLYWRPLVFVAKGQPSNSVILNRALARQLEARLGDEIFLRIRKSTAFSGDISIAPRSDADIALRLRVHAIAEREQGGDFSLRANNTPPLNAFVRGDELETAMNLQGKANILLASELLTFHGKSSATRFERFIMKAKAWLKLPAHDYSVSDSTTYNNSNLAVFATLSDYELDWRKQTDSGAIELRSARIFLDPPVAAKVSAVATNGIGISTYLVNLLESGTNATPYSMVTAAGSPWTPVDMRDDEIMVSQWLADDLQVKTGDEVALTYFDPESGARLSERSNTFRVRGIVPAELPWNDRTLMPDFPGIEKAESTSEWDAGFPLVHKIRPKDEDYWKKYRGTPKAFVTLAAGQKMWGNRFGNLTAIRFPIFPFPTNGLPPDYAARKSDYASSYGSSLNEKILTNLKPEELGLRFEPVREQALKAADKSQDFGGLFLGFSFFLIIAALLLIAMLFQFGLEQRAPEIGTLLALGLTPGQVRKLLLREGVALSFLGGALGAVGGIYFAKAMLHGLTTIWRDAVGSTSLTFHCSTQTLLIGLLASVIVSALTIWLALRKFVKRPARELLVGDVAAEQSRVRRPKSKAIAILAALAAAGLVVWSLAKGDTANTEIFFSAGSLALIAGLAFLSAWLRASEYGDRRNACPTLPSLALQGCARRRKRSLGTAAMLACGSFLIVSIGVFRLDANRDATKRDSGTGGFALIGESTMPIVHDLNASFGRDFFALNETDIEGVHFVPFRVREGDEASCLNLNAAQRPRLLGVKPEMLDGRFGFAKGDGWRALTSAAATEIPAIGDANSIQWAMHKKVGDTIDYVDERGQAFKVRIVGAVANSILQGQLLIDEAQFVKRFPGESGYRMFLIDAPSNTVAQVSETLSRAMQDIGLELTPAAQRLAQFNAVQNTYLGTFQVLGGLGLLLGSVGLGIVVLRNVLERRGELAVLMAVGFRKATVQSLLLLENGALLFIGLGIGVVAAIVAVLPAALSPGTQLPYASLALTLAAVLANGVLWTWVATRLAVRGDLLKALRNE